MVRWAGRCGERTERCQWQRKRRERVAAVKILSVRRKAAQKFWAPQQDHRPLRRFDKKVPAWNPPVTALPCQGPLGKRVMGEEETDCHDQFANWSRNDSINSPNTNLYVRTPKGTRAPGREHGFLGGYFFFRSIRKTSTSMAIRDTAIRTIHRVI